MSDKAQRILKTAQGIKDLFTWGHTDEGYQYWHTVYEALTRIASIYEDEPVTVGGFTVANTAGGAIKIFNTGDGDFNSQITKDGALALAAELIRRAEAS